MLALIALAELLGMTLWFSATAVSGAIAREFGLGPGAAAWLTMSVQAGFVAGTLASALASLPDVVNARTLFAIGATIGAVANTVVAGSDRLGSVLAGRFVTGLALAWVYPPALKLAAGWTVRRRGTALGLLVGALTAGSAVPHLLPALAAELPWRALVLACSGLALAGAAIVRGAVRDGPHLAPTAPFNPRAAVHVFTERGTRLATLGYLGHMWELYAMWTWIGSFAAASLAASGAASEPADAARYGSLIAFVAVASGAPGSLFAGIWGDRVGKARVAGAAMLLSGVCALGAALAFGRTTLALAVFAAVWGAAVVADSAQFSALVAEHSRRDEVGTALTVQTALGFLLTMVSIRAIPAASERVGWAWAFWLLAPGPVAGAWAMSALDRLERRRLTTSS
jgi:MFS family permease